jgi:hypothetical protein
MSSTLTSASTTTTSTSAATNTTASSSTSNKKDQILWVSPQETKPGPLDLNGFKCPKCLQYYCFPFFSRDFWTQKLASVPSSNHEKRLRRKLFNFLCTIIIHKIINVDF